MKLSVSCPVGYPAGPTWPAAACSAPSGHHWFHNWTTDPGRVAEIVASRDSEPPTDGGPWRGPSSEEWVERIARGSTPVREYDEHGRFQAWIRPSDPQKRGAA